MVQGCIEFLWVPAPYCWSWGLPLSMVCIPCKTLLEKSNFLLTSGFQLQTAYELKTGACVSLCHSTGAPSGAGLCRPCACCQFPRIQMCISSAAFRKVLFPKCPPFLLALTLSMPPLLQGSLSPEWKTFYGHSPFRAACPRSLTLGTLSSYGS